MIKVYSHPRSGTHFIEAFIAKNFYPTLDLSIKPITWGHWANRKEKPEGNKYGKLFGHHYFPDENVKSNNFPKIYIYRDPRAVAFSIWNTANFIHPDLTGISFSDFLTTKIDWEGSPARKSDANLTVAEHWCKHVGLWHEEKIPNLLIIKYEDLKDNPDAVYKKICKKFFASRFYNELFFLKRKNITSIDSPVGLLPNEGKKDTWRNYFSDEDEQCFLSQIPNEKKRYLSF